MGLKVAVAPAGSPLTERFTGELYPLRAVSVTVKLALTPGATGCERLTAIEKSGLEDAPRHNLKEPMRVCQFSSLVAP